MSRQEQLQQVLERLSQSVPAIKGALLSSLDGMPIVHAVSDQSVDPARVAAMAATAVGVGRRIGETLKTGQMKELSLLASEGRIFIYLTADKGCLALVAGQDCNVGLINLEATDTIAALNNILK
ncbi:Roadblock/LC7 domain protein [compost metagenome]|jgi:predicted regulator of Ras-like GTPase activity (Roadblock/LC7/MglB family)